MFNTKLIALAVAIGMGLATPNATLAQPRDSGYVSVNGLQMYYEIHGAENEGIPLVLLHGAFGTIAMFGKLLPALAETRTVIVPMMQGHGRTADIDRPLSYKQMADDTAGFLQKLGVEQADILGYSMGGGIALYVAKRHPELVRKLVVVGMYFSNDGTYPEVLAMEENMTADTFAGTPMKKAYTRVAPNPNDFGTLVAKIKEMALTFEGLEPEEVKAIQAPALIISADSGIVRPEHAVKMVQLFGGGRWWGFKHLPRSRLAILPGTTHLTLIRRVDWLVPMVTEFLDASMHKTE